MPIGNTTPNPVSSDAIILSGNNGDNGCAGAALAALNQSIEDFGKLSQGWDSYDADPPNSVSVQNARMVAEKCAHVGYQPSKALPSVEGGIGLIFDSRNKYADIECFNTGEILAVTSDGTNEPLVWNVEASEVERTLERIREFFKR